MEPDADNLTFANHVSHDVGPNDCRAVLDVRAKRVATGRRSYPRRENPPCIGMFVDGSLISPP